jgi:CRP/FNR family transcriptional regulator, cyclic AMP receptor protein
MAQYHDLVGVIDLFKPLSESERRIVATQCTWATYRPHVEILGEGESSTDIFFVADGEVSAKSFSSGGREVTLNTIGSGKMFGEFSAIDGQPRSASIITITNATIARMTSGAFRDLLSQHPGIALLFSEHLVGKIRLISNRVFEYSTLPACNRIRAELLRMCGQMVNGGGIISIDPAPSHYELATRLSTHREAVSRELSFLASRKVIELGRRRIRVLDMERLVALAEAREAD